MNSYVKRKFLHYSTIGQKENQTSRKMFTRGKLMTQIETKGIERSVRDDKGSFLD